MQFRPFYAVDRFASYQLKWKKLYESGAVILADRYSTSNMIYQAAKIGEKELKKEYLEWLRIWSLINSLYRNQIR